MLTLLDGSCDDQAEGHTTMTGVSSVSPSSPGTAQHSDGLSFTPRDTRITRYDVSDCYCLEGYYWSHSDSRTIHCEP